MSRIAEVLEAAGLGQDAARAAEESILRDYRSKEETDKKAERIRALEDEVAGYREQVEGLRADGAEVEALKAKVAEHERADAERREREAAEQARERFRAEFDAAVGGRKFANEYTAESVFEKAYEQHGRYPDADTKEIVDKLTGGDGVFADPRRDPARQPMPSGDAKDEDGAFAGFVSKLLKG